MAGKRPYSNALIFISKEKDELKRMYEDRANNVEDIAEHFNISRNMTVIALGALGYPAPPWAKAAVQTLKDRVAAEKLNRTVVNEPLDI